MPSRDKKIDYRILSLCACLAIIILAGYQIDIVTRASYQPAPAAARASKTVFTVPIGTDGLKYEDEGIEDLKPWGPAAFTIDGAGNFWIADTPNNRLLRYSRFGALTRSLDLTGKVVGISDVEVSERGVFAFDESAEEPAVLNLDTDGTLLSRYQLSEEMRREGLTGIKLDESGALQIELFHGATVTELVENVERGKLQKQLKPLAGHLRNGIAYNAQPADFNDSSADHSRGTISMGGIEIEVRVVNMLGGLSLLQVNADNSLYVMVEEVVSTPQIIVDQTVRHYSAQGELLGIARVPLAERYTYVKQGVSVAPDGELYALITHPQAIEVRRLKFSRGLSPILPAMGTGVLFESAIAPQACTVSRATAEARAWAIRDNQKYLTTTNLSGSCGGRGKPRYLGTAAGTYRSVAYDWGGFDYVTGYNDLMNQGYKAGDIDTAGVESCSRGLDCSGFVSRCWNTTSKYGTATLPNISFAISSSNMLRGDVMNDAGSHVVMFHSYTSGGIWDWEATKYNAYDRTVWIISSWSRLSGYVPRRYNNIC